MSDHGTHHHDADHSSEIKSKTAFKSSFWFVIILVGLFIAALNFINVMGHEEEHHSGAKEGRGIHDHETIKGHEEGFDTAAAAHHVEAVAPDTFGHKANH